VFTKPGVVSNTLLLRMDNSRDPLTDAPFHGPSRHSFDLPFGETHFLNLLRPLWLVQRKQFKMLQHNPGHEADTLPSGMSTPTGYSRSMHARGMHNVVEGWEQVSCVARCDVCV